MCGTELRLGAVYSAMEGCLDNSIPVLFRRVVAGGVTAAGALLLISVWGVYSSYPQAVPPWTAISLGVVIAGSTACLVLSIIGLFLPVRKSQFIGFIVLTLIMLPLAGFLKNGDSVRSSSPIAPQRH